MAASPELLIDELKRTAKQKVITSIFGTGIVGRALKEKYVKKQPSERTVVNEALVEQNTVQRQINTTIIKLEPLVTNIAKTINQIATVWSKHVFAKKEQLRQSREQASKAKSATEEEENERKQAEQVAVQKESLTGMTSAEDTSGKGGVLGAVLASTKSTKSFVRGALLKIGALIAGAGVVAAVGAGTIYGMKLANEDDGENEDNKTPPAQENKSPQTSVSNNIREVLGISPPGAPAPEGRGRGRNILPAEAGAPASTYLAAQEAGIAGTPSTLVSTPSVISSATPSPRREDPLFFQRNIDVTAGESPSTIQAISQPNVSVSSPLPLPPPSIPYTNQSTTTQTTNNSGMLPIPTSNGVQPTQVYSRQIDATAGESPSTIQAPTSSLAPQQPAPPPSIQQFFNTMQQPGNTIDSPASLVSAMSNVASSFTGTPSSLASDIVGGLSGVTQAMSSNIGGLSDFVAPKVELGNQLSSMTTAFQNLLRNLTQNVTPISLSQPGITNQDAVIEGDSPLLPTPVADRGSLDIDTTFESQY